MLSGRLPCEQHNAGDSIYDVLLFVRMAINIPPNSGFFNNAHNFTAANCNFTEVLIIV